MTVTYSNISKGDSIYPGRKKYEPGPHIHTDLAACDVDNGGYLLDVTGFVIDVDDGNWAEITRWPLNKCVMMHCAGEFGGIFRKF